MPFQSMLIWVKEIWVLDWTNEKSHKSQVCSFFVELGLVSLRFLIFLLGITFRSFKAYILALSFSFSLFLIQQRFLFLSFHVPLLSYFPTLSLSLYLSLSIYLLSLCLFLFLFLSFFRSLSLSLFLAAAKLPFIAKTRLSVENLFRSLKIICWSKTDRQK